MRGKGREESHRALPALLKEGLGVLGWDWGLERAGRRQIKTKACSKEAKSPQPQEPDPQGMLKRSPGVQPTIIWPAVLK